jgi:8-oxo-dGTP pyrophosphatase MutT (NUDIX family)
VSGEVRLAATVILMRPGAEVYLARRSATSAFAPDAFVFPGGTIDPQDASSATRSRVVGLEAARIRSEFRATIPAALPSGQPKTSRDAARTLFVTALRELFEEAGVVLARTRTGRPIEASGKRGREVAAARIEVRNGALRFADFLKARDWYADARALTLFSHWITPPSEPRRYNTHFFFAAAPADQAARADAIETHDGLWISPNEALALYRSQRLRLVYPTIKHLERLASFGSLEAALAFARSKPILTIVPTSSDDGGFSLPPALEDAW